MYDLFQIQDELKNQLSKKRYQHTLSVAYLAASLAMCYKEDPNASFLAGLLHDCAKYLTDDEILIKCDEYQILYNDYEREHPFLLHANLGAHFAKQVYHVESEEILNAVLYHTTGRPAMTFLEKSVFVADYIELFRTHLFIDEFIELRGLAFKDLNQTVFQIADRTIRYLEENNSDIDYRTSETREYYRICY